MQHDEGSADPPSNMNNKNFFNNKMCFFEEFQISECILHVYIKSGIFGDYFCANM